MFGLKDKSNLRKENFEYMAEKYHMLSDLRDLENKMMNFVNKEAEKYYDKGIKLEELVIDKNLYDAIEDIHNLIGKYSPCNTAPVGDMCYPKVFIYFSAFGPVKIKRGLET